MTEFYLRVVLVPAGPFPPVISPKERHGITRSQFPFLSSLPRNMENFYLDHVQDAFGCMSGLIYDNLASMSAGKTKKDAVHSFLQNKKKKILVESEFLSDVVPDIPPELLGTLLYEELTEQRDEKVFCERATGGALAFIPSPDPKSDSDQGCLLYPGGQGLSLSILFLEEHIRPVFLSYFHSPHVLGEVLVASERGSAHLWSAGTRMQKVREESANLYFNANSQWRWCEFSAHPRVMTYADRTGAELTDMRYTAYLLDERLPGVPMLKMDHMMQSPPVFCHVSSGVGTTKVLLGSQSSQEITLLQYSGGRMEASSSCGPPRALLSPRDSLKLLPVQIPHRQATASDRLSSHAAEWSVPGLNCELTELTANMTVHCESEGTKWYATVS
ncbi:TATA box-binding protein-associated factor, RNA polymerase I, subunit C-like [Neosynchiropus ocellatus]